MIIKITFTAGYGLPRNVKISRALWLNDSLVYQVRFPLRVVYRMLLFMSVFQPQHVLMFAPLTPFQLFLRVTCLQDLFLVHVEKYKRRSRLAR